METSASATDAEGTELDLEAFRAYMAAEEPAVAKADDETAARLALANEHLARMREILSAEASGASTDEQREIVNLVQTLLDMMVDAHGGVDDDVRREAHELVRSVEDGLARRSHWRKISRRGVSPASTSTPSRRPPQGCRSRERRDGSRRRSVRAGPDDDPDPAGPGSRVCAAPGCENEIPPFAENGKPTRADKRTCSPGCKKALQRVGDPPTGARRRKLDRLAEKHLRERVRYFTAAIEKVRLGMALGAVDDVVGNRLIQKLQQQLPEHFLKHCKKHGTYDGEDPDGCPDCFGLPDAIMRSNGTLAHNGRLPVVPRWRGELTNTSIRSLCGPVLYFVPTPEQLAESRISLAFVRQKQPEQEATRLARTRLAVAA